MATEIERKFVLRALPRNLATCEAWDDDFNLRQGYICTNPVELRLRHEWSGGADARGVGVHTVVVKAPGEMVRTEVGVDITPVEFERLWSYVEDRVTAELLGRALCMQPRFHDVP